MVSLIKAEVKAGLDSPHFAYTVGVNLGPLHESLMIYVPSITPNSTTYFTICCIKDTPLPALALNIGI